MKRSFLAVLALALMLRGDDLIVGAPAGNTITMTGSAIRLVPNPSTANPLKCASIFIQSQPGSTAPIYVLNAAPNITASLNGAGTTTVATLGPGTSTQPGQSFTFPSNGESGTQTGGTDLRYWAVYGTASDTAIAICTIKQ